MDNQTVDEEIRCPRCGSPLRISTSPSNRGELMQCRKCYRADYYAANRNKAISASKKYYRETRPRRLKLAKDWRDNNLERHRLNGWHTKLRLRCSNPEYYAAKLREQGNVCAICKNPRDKIRLAQDHCHKSKKPRGLLCKRCNFEVGQYESLRGRAAMFESYLAQYEKENESCTTLQWPPKRITGKVST